MCFITALVCITWIFVVLFDSQLDCWILLCLLFFYSCPVWGVCGVVLLDVFCLDGCRLCLLCCYFVLVDCCDSCVVCLGARCCSFVLLLVVWFVLRLLNYTLIV